MTAFVQALSNRFYSVDVETDTLTILAVLCGVGLVVSLIFAGYGFDLSPGF